MSKRKSYTAELEAILRQFTGPEAKELVARAMKPIPNRQMDTPEEAGGKTVLVTLTPEATAALEELQNLLKQPDESMAPSQAEVISRVLVWGLKGIEAAAEETSRGKELGTQEDASRATLEQRVAEIETRLSRVESAMGSDWPGV